MSTTSEIVLDSWWFSFLELGGVFVFAISGAIASVRRQLDPFGVLVISFITACGGGLLRDVMIGDLPPAVMNDLRYPTVTVIAGLLTFYGFRWINKLDHPFLWFDAIGLGLFSIIGAAKALDFQISPGWAILMGLITGIGGGVMRDIMLAQIPLVLRADVYALPAFIGSAILVCGVSFLYISPAISALFGAGICVTLRLLAIRYQWKISPAPFSE